MPRLLALAVMLVVMLAGCAAPSTTHQPGPTAPGSPAGSASPAAVTSGPGTPPAGNTTAPAGKTTTTPKPPTKPPSASASTRLAGALSFDPLANARCTWVPRLFVDLSGKAKPGVRVQVPLWVTRLTAPVTFTVRGALNGPGGERTTDTVTADTPPEWRGSASLAMAIPAGDDAYSVYVEADVHHKVSDGSLHTVIAGTLSNPRPAAETTLSCKRVT